MARGTSQERLAADAGLERRHVGAIERGEENPTVATLDRIAAALGIDITDLFARPKLGATLPPPGDMERLFRNRVARLAQVLNATPEIQIEAGQILRAIVSEIVLTPGDERGHMLIEVCGNPTALAVAPTENRQNGMITVVEGEKPGSNILHFPKEIRRFVNARRPLRWRASNCHCPPAPAMGCGH